MLPLMVAVSVFQLRVSHGFPEGWEDGKATPIQPGWQLATGLGKAPLCLASPFSWALSLQGFCQGV